MKTVTSEPDFAGTSVPRHLARGVLGFGLIAGAIALVPAVGPVALLAAPLSLIAFRGCPTCWMVGLVQTVSRDRLRRTCTDGVCTLTATPRPDRAVREDAERPPSAEGVRRGGRARGAVPVQPARVRRRS